MYWLNKWIDCLISMAYFCLSGDGLGVIWAKIGGQWPSVAQVNVQQAGTGDVCSSVATQPQDTWQGLGLSKLLWRKLGGYFKTTNAVWNSSFYILNIYICIRSGQWWNQSASDLNSQSEARRVGALTNKRVGKCHQSTDCHLSPPLTMGPGISDRQLTPRHNTGGQGWALMMIQLGSIFCIL